MLDIVEMKKDILAKKDSNDITKKKKKLLMKIIKFYTETKKKLLDEDFESEKKKSCKFIDIDDGNQGDDDTSNPDEKDCSDVESNYEFDTSCVDMEKVDNISKKMLRVLQHYRYSKGFNIKKDRT